MIYNIEKKDLFKVDFDEYAPAHCISADCKMGAGIAVPIRKKFSLGNMSNDVDRMLLRPGVAVYYHKVYNLITKEKYWHKPTYDTIEAALASMYYHAKEHGMEKIVMPKIGSGLDQLSWPKVEDIIMDIFKDLDIKILVCYL